MNILVNNPNLKLESNTEKTIYILDFDLVNNNVNLESIINYNIIKLVYDINKADIFEDFKLEIHSESSATVYILFKHFFEDFGIPQKYVDLNIILTKVDNQYIFKSNTNNNNNTIELVPIYDMETICTVITPNKISIKNITKLKNPYNFPEFIEKFAINVISKIFLRTKQFIEKLRI